MTMGPSHVGPTGGTRGRDGIRRVLAAVIGLAAIWGSPARCADADAAPRGLRMPDPLFSLRDMYPDLAAAPAVHTATREFQPRVNIARAPDAGAVIHDRSGDLQLTNAWQRLGDYRSENGIRLLTVWQATAGTVALHEGRHGGTSLQWTSNMMSHGNTSRGLLDHLFSAAGGMHLASQMPAPVRPVAREPVALRTASPP